VQTPAKELDFNQFANLLRFPGDLSLPERVMLNKRNTGIQNIIFQPARENIEAE
jgi:hypothetical protein